jgi:hypothetical protein
VTLEKYRFGAEQVEAPQRFRRVTQQRQPRRTTVPTLRTVVICQHTPDDVFVQLDSETPGQLLGNLAAAQMRVATFEFDDGLDQLLSRPFRAGLWQNSARSIGFRSTLSCGGTDTNHHEGQDLTQGFFERLFKRSWLDGVGKEKGRFRTFLLCALSNFLINEREKQLSLKRGGAVEEFVLWDAELAESRLTEMSGSKMDPVMEFERLWACSLIERALAILKNEYDRCGKDALFATLSQFMSRPVPPNFYGDAATNQAPTRFIPWQISV